MPKQMEKSSQAEPQAAHAQPVDSRAQAAQVAAQEPPSLAAVDQASPMTPTTGHGQLQDILPEIHRLAARVGGLKRLAEIIAALEPSKE